MTPILTIWPSAATRLLAECTSEYMTKSGLPPGVFSSVETDGMTDGSLVEELHRQYRSLISLDSMDTTLHAVAILPLYRADASARAEQLFRCIAAAGNRMTLDIVGLQWNVRGAVNERKEGEAQAEGNETPAEPTDNESATFQRSNVDAIRAMATGGDIRCSITLTDDYLASGAAVGFDRDLLGRYLSTLLRVLAENYPEIFNPAIFSVDSCPLLGTGLSEVSFRRSEIVEYLLHRSFVAALDKVNITQKEVDAQNAMMHASEVLQGIGQFFSGFYDRHAVPLLERNVAPGDIAARVAGPLRAEVDALRSEICSLLRRKEMSLPEKEAALAMVLGRDNDRLKGMLYQETMPTFDDAYSEPMELYISSYNSHAKGTSLLPVRGMFKPLKKYTYDTKAKKIVPSEENNEAFNPLPELKRLKGEILDLTSYMRRKTEEVARMKKQLNTLADSTVGDGDGTEGRRRNVYDKPQEAFADIYVPSKDLKLPASVDLRGFFSEIRDQGDIGSCASFAAAAMYESICNAGSGAGSGKANLSEMFLFYHSNIVKGEPQGGSNYYEQMQVLAEKGICEESLYPYTTDSFSTPPPSTAFSDAHKHRVVKACMIPLDTTEDSIEGVKENHRMLTSALAEGYGVGISLKIYRSFQEKGAYIHRPDESDIASGEEGHHAMVLVGYSESDKCYIVRNSWGKGWGDKGYAYISSAYIDDPCYNSFACIITETTEKKTTRKIERAPLLVAPFAGTETEIRIAATLNALDEARLTEENMSKRYRALYTYYSELTQAVATPQVRNQLRQAAEASISENISDLNSRMHRQQNGKHAAVKEYCRKYIVNAISWSVCSLGAGGIMGMLIYNGIIGWPTVVYYLLSGILGLITVLVWMNYSLARRRYRHELQTEIDDLAESIGRLERKRDRMHLRYHLAGMAIDAIHELGLELDNIYHRLVSYNGYLRQWHADDSEAGSVVPEGSRAMFVSLTDVNLLDTFFSSHRERILQRINPEEEFLEHYLPETETIGEVRARLAATTGDAIGVLMRDFHMADFLSGFMKCDYAVTPVLNDLLSRMRRMAVATTRHCDTESEHETTFVSTHVEQSRLGRWRQCVEPGFAFPPTCVNSTDRDRMTLLTMRVLPADSIKWQRADIPR